MEVTATNQTQDKLDSTVADQLKKYFFEPGNFAKHLTDMGFDLGQLRQTTQEKINQAEQILKTLDILIPELEKKDNVAKEIESHNEITALGKQFYELIPHLPTVHQMPLDKLENVNTKHALVKNLRYILDAFETLNTTKPSQNFLESLYSNLKYTIQPVAKDDKLYDTVKQYGEINSVSDNSQIYLEVNSIFSCSLKNSENKEATRANNKMLAWYGDRLACYSGILSKGFQYKDTLLDGGEPAYCFADSVVKAMSSCYLDRYNREAFLLLCEVALGETLEVDKMDDLKQVDKKYDSVKLRGKNVPTAEGKKTIEEDITVPIGKITATNEEAKSLHNNYMVFNADQIKLRYIVKFDIKYH